MTKCKHCGITMHKGEICWLCELEQSDTKEVFVHFNLDGKILVWQSVKSELCSSPLEVKDFINTVKRQYREG